MECVNKTLVAIVQDFYGICFKYGLIFDHNWYFRKHKADR